MVRIVVDELKLTAPRIEIVRKTANLRDGLSLGLYQLFKRGCRGAILKAAYADYTPRKDWEGLKDNFAQTELYIDYFL